MISNILNKRKILILIPNFLPGYKMGGPLTSVVNLIENLADDYCFEVLTSDRDMGDSKPYDNISFNSWLKKSSYDVCYLNSNILLFFRLIARINSSKADIIYLNSLFNPSFSIFILICNKIGLLKSKKIILAPRGETYSEALNFKRKKKSFYIRIANKFNLYQNIFWHASTEIEKESIVNNLNINPQMIHIALNLVQKKSEDEYDFNNIIQSNNNEDLYLIFLSRVSKDKNILFTFDILREIKTNVFFHIFGPIEDDFIWQRCKEKINTLPSNIVVEYKGTVAKDNVKRVFCEYDLMFLPTFAENFGHVIVESLSVGTPVLLSDNTPWKNLDNKGFGWDISLKNPELFINVINYMSTLSVEDKKNMKINIKNNFSLFLNNSDALNANKILFNL